MVHQRGIRVASLAFTMTLCGLVAVIGAAVALHAGAAPGQRAAAASRTVPSGTDALALGKKVYAANCVVCHSIAGKGGSIGPDLTATGAAPGHTARWLEDQVASPTSHTPASTMPSFAGKIKGREMTALVTYLASLKGRQAATSPGGALVVKTAHLDPAIVAKIERLGGSVQQIAQTDDRLEVSFHLLGSAITDAALAPLAGLKHVIHLDLGQTAVSDAGLAHLRGMTELADLHLEGTRVTDAGLAHLAGLHQLSYLNLYGTQITDAGLEHLTGLTSLRHLYVWQTKVTEAGATKLRKALPQLDVVMGWDQAPKK